MENEFEASVRKSDADRMTLIQRATSFFKKTFKEKDEARDSTINPEIANISTSIRGTAVINAAP